ncbi:MAG: hypothetical protein AB1589_01020 [Cyanobacteriota bacterium]
MQVAFSKRLPEPNPRFETPSTALIRSAVLLDAHKLPEKLRKAIAKLERLDIGWLDILTTMANLSEQLNDEQVAAVMEATALELKRNRRILRDL